MQPDSPILSCVGLPRHQKWLPHYPVHLGRLLSCCRVGVLCWAAQPRHGAHILVVLSFAGPVPSLLHQIFSIPYSTSSCLGTPPPHLPPCSTHLCCLVVWASTRWSSTAHTELAPVLTPTNRPYGMFLAMCTGGELAPNIQNRPLDLIPPYCTVSGRIDL